MTFRDWQQLAPAQAAREVHERVRTRLSPAQQRAVITHLPNETVLAKAFADAPRDQPLSGVPYFLKDLFPVVGQPMFAGSTFLPEIYPPAKQDAAVVQKLRQAGAVMVGRTHLQEFAYGITGENPHYGDCEHPKFPGHLTGGSSSGSAAVVAADIVPLAIGSDTGGSVRLPAAFCGLFGLRLTPGDRFVADAFPLAPSYDTAGWFTRTAAEMETTAAALVGSGSAANEPNGRYVELPGLETEVALSCRQAAARLAAPAEQSVQSSFLEGLQNSVDTYNTIVADEAWKIHAPWAERFKDRYDPAVWQRLNRVRQLTTAQRAAAATSTQSIRQMWADYFRHADFLVLPASPCAALTKAQCTLENRARILALTSPASIGGYPVLTIPVALPSGLSTGLQVVVRSVDSPVVRWALKKFSRE